MPKEFGAKRWAVAEGYIPAWSNEPEPRMLNHETICMLNTTKDDAHVEIMIYFSDKHPIGPYRVRVPAQRTLHLLFNNLTDPKPIPKDTDYAYTVESDVPIVVQHTRLGSRQAENTIMTTIAFAQA